ncbi:MAG: ribonuclease R [Gammaproteobacteria bacterium]|nr:ribonuclease R [Gammaproteobacteria bacterium]MBT5202109.1 ribonuclease R [Gammaproteobacteria bacterium]MBT5601184.1 ribonuclease R [Gammaproteobacteria bacterium]MBT6246408.1 ribonuclease R [Gammaproteobacteria bacterium]
MATDPHSKREARRYANPIASREYILETLVKEGSPLTARQLAKRLGLEGMDQKAALKARLAAMAKSRQVSRDKRNAYWIASKADVATGRVLAHPDGFGFLQTSSEDDDVFLSEREMRSVFHGDEVRVEIASQRRRGKLEGRITEVVQRRTQHLAGRLVVSAGAAVVEPLHRRIKHEIVVEQAVPAGMHSGQIVSIEITRQPGWSSPPQGRIIEVLADQLTPSTEIEVVLQNHAIPYIFPDSVNQQVNKIPARIPASEIQSRFDLRELDFVTIDGEDARDFDDAVFCEQTDTGWCLRVAIADVAHYVRQGTALDKEAVVRGTSVYFPQQVVPMLPEKLSNGLCSLKPDEDRLVLVCEMDISTDGKLQDYLFYEAVIHSKARLTYSKVADYIAGNRTVFAPASPLPAAIDSLFQLYQCLLKARLSRGALEIDTRELHIAWDEQGTLSSLQPVARNDAHRMIEECMLCANVATAGLIEQAGLPGLYRVHEKPDEAKLTYLSNMLAQFGVSLDPSNHQVSARDYQKILDQVSTRPYAKALQMVVLRSMKQAIYSQENSGHFGLNYPAYGHFTSPIRRLADLINHRLIKHLISSDGSIPHLRRQLGSVSPEPYPYDSESMEVLALAASQTERRADGAVYEVLEWLKCEYLKQFLGEDFGGIITSVTKFGFFVELDQLFVEGLVSLKSLSGGYYRFDAEHQRLHSDSSGVSFRLGDAVTVQIADIHSEQGQVDFELLSHQPLARGSKSTRKTRKRHDTTAKKGFRTKHKKPRRKG